MTLAELNFRPDQVRDLYLVHLRQLYSAEQQLLDAVPTIAVELSATKIRQILLNEASQTPDHLELLETVFGELGELPTGPLCMPMKALVDLAAEVTLQHPLGPGRDLLLTALALEMKHLNIAKYTMAATFARALNLSNQVLAFSKVERAESSISQGLKFLLQDPQGALGKAADPQIEADPALTSRPQHQQS